MRLLLVAAFAVLSAAQTKTVEHGQQRIEITLERREGNAWKSIDPGLVLAQGDRVRFRMRANFDGYLYVTNLGTSAKYEQLFPRQETGRENRISAGREYLIPSTEAAFRIAGPSGYEVTYWLMNPVPLEDLAPPRPAPPTGVLLPRCDDEIFRARGECIDSTAGARGLGPEVSPSELMFVRKQNTSVIASPAPLTVPAVYEFRLAHK